MEETNQVIKRYKQGVEHGLFFCSITYQKEEKTTS